jgi:hypothetical protein
MGSNTKRRTTMAKIQRENAVRDRRLRKQARKDARKSAAESPATRSADALEDTGAAPAE